jgi:hypothetical protein
MSHTSKEGGLILKISDSKALQTSYTSSTNRSRAIRTTLACFPHQLRLVTSGHIELADIGNNDESSGEYAFVPSFCTLHEFSTKNNIQ